MRKRTLLRACATHAPWMVRSRAIHAPARMLVPINGNDLPAHQSHHTTPKQCILIISAKHPLVTVLVLIRVRARIGTSPLREAARARKLRCCPPSRAWITPCHTSPIHSRATAFSLLSSMVSATVPSALSRALSAAPRETLAGFPIVFFAGNDDGSRASGIVDARSSLR